MTTLTAEPAAMTKKPKQPKAGPRTPAKKRKKMRIKPVVKTISRFDMIANQMMRGFMHARSKPIPAETIMAFQRRHKDVIEWVENNLPTKISVGVLGAIGKAVLWYGKDKMQPFCEALKKGNFNGHGDPAHVLYLWLMGRARYNTRDAYQRTVTAIRAFVDGRQIVRTRGGEVVRPNLFPAETDLFEWDETYTLMVKRHKRPGTNSTESKSIYDVVDDSVIEEEVRQVLGQ